MNDLFSGRAMPVSRNSHRRETLSSLEIAEITGKQHKHVLRDISEMLAKLQLAEGPYLGARQIKAFGGVREERVYHLPKRECLILASGYSVELRAKIIDRWLELEAREQPKNPLEGIDLEGALTLALESERARKKAEAAFEKAKPAIEGYNALMNTDDVTSISDMCREIGIIEPVKTFFPLLREKGFLTLKNLPTAYSIEHGWIICRERKVGDKVRPQAMVPRRQFDRWRKWAEKHRLISAVLREQEAALCTA